MARSFGWRYSKLLPGEEWEDYFHSGIICLCEICPKVDFQNPNYSGYVLMRVRGMFLNYIYRNAPRTKVKSTTNETQEMADEGNRSKRAVTLIAFDDLVDTGKEPHDPLDAEKVDYLLDLGHFKHQVQLLFAKFMDSLEPEEQFIIIARFVDGRTFEEIGRNVGRRREWVSHKIRNILGKLARFLRGQRSWRLSSDDLEGYLKETQLDFLVIMEADNEDENL